MTSRADAAVYDAGELEETYDSLRRLNYGTATVSDLREDAIDPVVYDLFEDADVGDDSIELSFEAFTEYMDDLEDTIDGAQDTGRWRSFTDAVFRKGYDDIDARLEEPETDPEEVYREVQRQGRKVLRTAGAVKGGPVVGLGAGYALDPLLAAPGALVGLFGGVGAVVNAQYRHQGRERRIEEELSGDELDALADHRVRVRDRDGKTWSPERYTSSSSEERDWTQEDVEEAIERLRAGEAGEDVRTDILGPFLEVPASAMDDEPELR